MLFLVLAMLLSVALAVTVMGMVAIPARRAGREMLTPKGEDVMSRVREKTGTAMETARDKTGGAMGAARDKVAHATSSKDS